MHPRSHSSPGRVIRTPCPPRRHFWVFFAPSTSLFLGCYLAHGSPSWLSRCPSKTVLNDIFHFSRYGVSPRHPPPHSSGWKVPFCHSTTVSTVLAARDLGRCYSLTVVTNQSFSLDCSGFLPYSIFEMGGLPPLSSQRLPFGF